MATTGPAKLIVRLADGKTQAFDLGEQTMHIGRDPSCEISIPSQFVSRHHARISAAGDGFLIQDEGSKNRLHINGRLALDPHPLAHGDRVQIGDVLLTFEAAPVEPEDPLATAVYELAPIAVQAGAAEGIPAREASGGALRESRPAGTWSILYTDLVGHTRQVTAMGDVAGQRWLHTHNTLLRRQFERYEGLVDKGLGDGFLVTFASGRRAVQCAVAIQRELAGYNREHPDAPILVRIGLHTGEVLKEGDELFGSAVILAARVMAKAGAGEILVSDLMRRLIQGTGEFPILDRGSFVLKGFPQRQRLYEVRWQTES